MVTEVIGYTFGARGKLLGCVLQRTTEARAYHRPSFTIALFVQTTPEGRQYELGIINLLPMYYDSSTEIHRPANLHYHRRSLLELQKGENGPAEHLPFVDDPFPVIEQTLFKCREWITEGGFPVDDDFSNNADFGVFVEACMTRLKIISQPSKSPAIQV